MGDFLASVIFASDSANIFITPDWIVEPARSSLHFITILLPIPDNCLSSTYLHVTRALTWTPRLVTRSKQH